MEEICKIILFTLLTVAASVGYLRAVESFVVEPTGVDVEQIQRC